MTVCNATSHARLTSHAAASVTAKPPWSGQLGQARLVARLVARPAARLPVTHSALHGKWYMVHGHGALHRALHSARLPVTLPGSWRLAARLQSREARFQSPRKLFAPWFGAWQQRWQGLRTWQRPYGVWQGRGRVRRGASEGEGGALDGGGRGAGYAKGTRERAAEAGACSGGCHLSGLALLQLAVSRHRVPRTAARPILASRPALGQPRA